MSDSFLALLKEGRQGGGGGGGSKVMTMRNSKIESTQEFADPIYCIW